MKLSLWEGKVVSQPSTRQKVINLAHRHLIGLVTLMQLSLRDLQLKRALRDRSRQSLWTGSLQGQVRQVSPASHKKRLRSQSSRSHSQQLTMPSHQRKTNHMPLSSQVRGFKSKRQPKMVHLRSRGVHNKTDLSRSLNLLEIPGGTT